MKAWPANRGFASVERGPLTYSLQIRQRRVRSGGSDAWPAWDLFPDSPWNYALEPGPTGSGGRFRVVRGTWPKDDQPWAESAEPIRIQAQARRLPQWGLDEKGLVQELQDSPVRTPEKVEDVMLVPMGAARLRISAFPVAGSGPDAKEWRP